MKNIIKRIPIISELARKIYHKWINPIKPFTNSKNYWIERYESGGTSGDGSYGKLAKFKAEILNEFVQRENIKTVIEFGCGDGNQLKLVKFPSYIGFDVSPEAINLCKTKFSKDSSKEFHLTDVHRDQTAELTLSLDVIYHLVEDAVFQDYMHRLFNSAEKFVIIYSSNTNKEFVERSPHVKHRKFSEWVDEMRPEWKLQEHIPNRYPYNGKSQTGSFADFFIYKKVI